MLKHDAEQMPSGILCAVMMMEIHGAVVRIPLAMKHGGMIVATQFVKEQIHLETKHIETIKGILSGAAQILSVTKHGEMMMVIQYVEEQIPLATPLIEMIRGIPFGVEQTHLEIQSAGRKST